MQPSESDLNDLVRRLVSSIQPHRIILFGSAARGEMGTHSDLDVLVVVPDGSNCRELARTAYRSLRGFAYPKDLIVVQKGDVEAYGANPYLVIHTALSEGRELYRAAS